MKRRWHCSIPIRQTDRAYLWAYSIGAHHPVKAGVYDFADSRAGSHARDFLGDGARWCVMIMPATRRCSATASPKPAAWRMPEKFFDLQSQNQSLIAGDALALGLGQLYQIEREAAGLPPEERQHLRQTRAKPIADQLHAWLMQQRQKVPNNSAYRQGHRLLSETLGCADTLPVRRADRSTTTGSKPVSSAKGNVKSPLLLKDNYEITQADLHHRVQGTGGSTSE